MLVRIWIDSETWLTILLTVLSINLYDVWIKLDQSEHLLEGYFDAVPGTLEASIGQLSNLKGSLQGILENAVTTVNQVLIALEKALESCTQINKCWGNLRNHLDQKNGMAYSGAHHKLSDKV